MQTQTHLIFLLLFLVLSSSTTTAHPQQHRRILHQPFFPQDSIPPSQPPNLPSTTTTTTTPPADQLPFFPTYPSPPPPPTPTTTTTSSSVPANVSSLSLPRPSSPKPISKKLIFTAVAAVIAAISVVAVVILLHIRKRQNQNLPNTHQKPQTPSNLSSVSSIPTNPIPRIPPRKSPQTSSEFLYLGTLANTNISNNTNTQHSNDTSSRKMESPDLQPLPPLKLSGQQPQQQNFQNADYSGPLIADEEDENDEFYSPKGSIGTGSRRTLYEPKSFQDERREIESTTSSSTSYTPSDSGGSPVRSVSLSISPPASLSPKHFSTTKSPELTPLQMKDLSDVSSQASELSSVDRVTSTLHPQHLGFTAASSPVSSSPERYISESQASSPTASHVSSPASSHRPSSSPARIHNFADAPSLPPPPPPPLPPTRQSESPKTPGTKMAQPVLRPPVLAAPSRPVTLATPALISPIEMPPQSTDNVDEDTPKLKLKPLHWDKVRASSDRETVWDHLRSSSFKLNEEMMETLFVVNKPTPTVTPNETTWRPVLPSSGQENRVLDPKKSQNVAILLRALNVTIEEVCEALLEGNADNLGTELLESLLKMAPTKEEERKLKEYKDDSPFKLGPAEKFLKSMLDIPFAFRRVEAMLYVSNFDSEVEYLKKSFETLEAACEELRTSRMFLKLLEAVLKTGNRMNVGTNRGDAQAFKLDTLLKLVDIKGADGKTTLLHFVVQEIIRTEGARLSNANQTVQPTSADDAKLRKLGLQVVSSISLDLTNVKKAASMDSEVLSGDVLKLSRGIGKIAEIVRMIQALESDENSRGFSKSMGNFVKMAEEEIIRTQAQESVALSLVKEITEYFHGNSAKEEAHPFRIFLVVRDFLTILDRVCKEVGLINERTIVSSAHKFPVPVNPTMPPGFAGFSERRQYDSSSDESSSP
ncbi:hypothetical protein DCAR_0314404 [Daucus carota subsp. sativus]|uniref:Formin-like protein n=2 Tax=Daucus carota subsp. sativus TaxID=79200 RepID=A0AAF1AVW8_DAUCS|nr:hypothetical protein DCAR_0314404 [Daucus carota subsp. sativus]